MRWPEGPAHLALNPPYLFRFVFLVFVCFLLLLEGKPQLFPLNKGIFALVFFSSLLSLFLSLFLYFFLLIPLIFSLSAFLAFFLSFFLCIYIFPFFHGCFLCCFLVVLVFSLFNDTMLT